MIDKEEKILRKHLDNDQMVILMQNDLLHLVAMAMRMYKNEDKLVENLSLGNVSNRLEEKCCHCKKNLYTELVPICKTKNCRYNDY